MVVLVVEDTAPGNAAGVSDRVQSVMRAAVAKSAPRLGPSSACDVLLF